MSVLVVMAHYDSARVLRRHTLSTLENYAGAADRVVVVSTSGVRDDDRERLPPNVEFVTRPNFGYDFFSYKWGLDIVGDYARYERIVIANDTFVGPMVPLATVIESNQAAEYDLMGMTWSKNLGGHAQSFFVTVNNSVARSSGFQRFWRDMVPISERRAVILKHEVGFTAAVVSSGFTAGGYLQPTPREEDLARTRLRHQSSVRLVRGRHDKVIRDMPSLVPEPRTYNPAIALADRVLVDARLPLLKFDTLRFDPYGLNARHLLNEAEAAYPEAMAGVRDFLRQTKTTYQYRPGEHNILSDPAVLKHGGLGYCMDGEFLEHRSLREIAT